MTKPNGKSNYPDDLQRAIGKLQSTLMRSDLEEPSSHSALPPIHITVDGTGAFPKVDADDITPPTRDGKRVSRKHYVKIGSAVGAGIGGSLWAAYEAYKFMHTVLSHL
jgi:hypothetical protein